MTTLTQMNTGTIEAMRQEASHIRYETVKLIHHAGAGHTGGDLSASDLLVTLYDYMKINPQNPDDPDRDYFIMSKGHSAEILYVVLANHGFFPKQELMSVGQFGTQFGGHPTIDIPGVETNTGSLGHGLSVAGGIALGLKRQSKENQVYVLTGDGELAEGSNWEAAMSISHFNLDNLTWIIDRNSLQISGSTESVMGLEPLQEKIKAFGFHTVVINGHSYDEIISALEENSDGRPKAIIAKTIKGYGLKPAENNVGWHHKVPSESDLENMRKYLNIEEDK